MALCGGSEATIDRVALGSAWIETGHGATAPLAASAKVGVARA